MNEQKHTPEPWIAGSTGDIETVTGAQIADFVPISHNADRIVACVNACAGIPIDVLTEPGYSIKAELDNLDAQIESRIKAERALENYLSVRGET